MRVCRRVVLIGVSLLLSPGFAEGQKVVSLCVSGGLLQPLSVSASGCQMGGMSPGQLHASVGDTAWVAQQVEALKTSISTTLEQNVSALVAKRLSDKQVVELTAAVKAEAINIARAQLEDQVRRQVQALQATVQALRTEVEALKARVAKGQ